MFNKSKVYLFFSCIMTTLSLCASDYQVTPLMSFLQALSYAMWQSLFFVPKILGALFLGNGTYIVTSIILLCCMILIESFLLKKHVTASYSSVVLRMSFINFIDILVQAVVALPLFYLIDLHNKIQDFYLKIYCFYILLILSALIILAFRILNSYHLYAWFDKSIYKKKLKNVFITLNCASYSFIVAIFLISKLTKYKIIF